MKRVFFCFITSVVAVACIHSTPVSKLQEPATVQVVLLRDHVHRRTASPVPEVVRQEIGRVLRARNLVPKFSDSSILAEFGTIRDTSTRLRRIAKQYFQNGKNSLVLLLETRVSFYSQLSGRYRWTVSASLSIAPVENLAEVHTVQFDMPAVLTYAHEKEDEALLATGSDIARRLGLLVDDFLAGKPSLSEKKNLRIDSISNSNPDLHGIYFVMVDRFANGDSSNDGDVDPGDPEAWHGGDLKGVLEHLDYIKKLGVDAIWLSPIFLSQKKKFNGHGAFHGYWTMDPNKVDSRFGTLMLLKKLVQEAHGRGMKIILDLVLNHVGYTCALVSEHPAWFHHKGTIKNWQDPQQLVMNEVHGLPDLAQENPEVFSWLLRAATSWLEKADIDGFRLDAVKHVPLDFWQKFNSALEANRPGVILLGEYYDGDPAKVDHVQREGHFSYMFDFPMAFALKDVFCSGKPAGKLGAILSNDRLLSSPNHLVTFVDNHDLPRIWTQCQAEGEKVRSALTAQFAMRGIPALTYGTEVGLTGAVEPQNRADMIFADGPSIGHLAKHIKKLFRLRRDNPALEHGKTRILSYEDGLLLFLRVVADSAVLVAINSRDSSAKCSLPLADVDARSLLDNKKIEDIFEIAAGHVKLIALAPHRTGAFSDIFESSGESRQVRVLVKAECLEKNMSISIAGSGPEMGQWNPQRAVGPLIPSDEGLETSFFLPVGLIFSFKLILKSADGRLEWEDGDDRYVFIKSGDGPLTLKLKWREC